MNDNYIYNLKSSHESDLSWENAGSRKKIKFFGVPLYIFRRGRLIETKSNDKRPSFFEKSNPLSLIKSIRSEKDIYIGYDRPTVLRVVNSLGVDDCNRYLINENDNKYESSFKYDNSVILFRYLIIFLAFVFISPIVIYYSFRMELKYIQMAKILGDIAFSRLLVLFSNKEKKIYFFGGVPFAVSYLNKSNFFEVQHGIIHNYYSSLVDQDDRRTPMIVWMDGGYNNINPRDIFHLKLKKEYGFKCDLHGIGLCGTTNGNINCRAINILQNAGVNIKYFKRHPRDIFNYKIHEIEFSQLMRLEIIYTFPSSIIQELIYNEYSGTLIILNLFNIDEDNFRCQVSELYFSANQSLVFRLKFLDLSKVNIL